jgi:hypothetical protein
MSAPGRSARQRLGLRRPSAALPTNASSGPSFQVQNGGGQTIQLSARQQPAHFNPMTQPATPLLSEPGQIRALKIICILFCVLSASCGCHHAALPSNSAATNPSAQAASGQDKNKSGNGDYQRSNNAATIDWEKVDKENEERLRNPHPSDWPFPNFETGPGRPVPIHANFYRINDRYPAYLLCQYDVKEKYYEQTNEPGWFNAALTQIRRAGPKKFPPIEWVAVIIFDRGEFKDSSTWEQCCKVGAIFKASDVFDSSRKFPQMIAHADMDRHPFKLDPQQPTPGEQQRWVIVEQHATNNPTAGSN